MLTVLMMAVSSGQDSGFQPLTNDTLEPAIQEVAAWRRGDSSTTASSRDHASHVLREARRLGCVEVLDSLGRLLDGAPAPELKLPYFESEVIMTLWYLGEPATFFEEAARRLAEAPRVGSLSLELLASRPSEDVLALIEEVCEGLDETSRVSVEAHRALNDARRVLEVERSFQERLLRDKVQMVIELVSLSMNRGTANRPEDDLMHGGPLNWWARARLHELSARECRSVVEGLHTHEFRARKLAQGERGEAERAQLRRHLVKRLSPEARRLHEELYGD